MFYMGPEPLFSLFLISWVYFNLFICCNNFSQCLKYIYYATAKYRNDVLSLTKNYNFCFSTDNCLWSLFQQTSLYVPDGAGHLSFWLQLVLRERRLHTKFRTLVTVIYFELHEGGNQLSKLPRLIHNYGRKTATAVLTVQSCRDSDRDSYLLRIQGTDLHFPNERGVVSPACNRFYTHNE